MTFASAVLIMTGKIKRFLKFLVVYAVFFALQLLAAAYGGSVGAFFTVFIVMSMQFVPCIMMASILIKDYGAGEIISALEPFRLPKPFVVALAIVVRYVPTFRKEYRDIKESMRLRNIPYSLRTPVKSFEFFIVPQLFRCSILADEITAAGLTKGITNPARRTSYCDMRMRLPDYIMCILLLAGLAVFIIWR